MFANEFRPALEAGDQDGQDNERPDCSMGQDFDCRHLANGLDVNGDKAPQAVGSDAVDEAEFRFLVLRVWVHVSQAIWVCFRVIREIASDYTTKLASL